MEFLIKYIISSFLFYVVSLKDRHSPQHSAYVLLVAVDRMLLNDKGNPTVLAGKCIYGCSKLRQRTEAFRKLILSVMEHGLYQVGQGGIWYCSHTNHYKLSHTVSRCIPTHISLISHASLILMQLPDDASENKYRRRGYSDDAADRISNFQTDPFGPIF